MNGEEYLHVNLCDGFFNRIRRSIRIQRSYPCIQLLLPDALAVRPSAVDGPACIQTVIAGIARTAFRTEDLRPADRAARLLVGPVNKAV